MSGVPRLGLPLLAPRGPRRRHRGQGGVGPMPGGPVRLVVLTGTCAVGKSTFAARLQGRLGGQVFHMDDYISAPPPPGYPPEWFRRRAGYLPEIGQKLAAALETSPITTFEGVLVGAEEVPTLAHSAGLSY